jgi:thymidylate synthase (FAD)
MKLIRPSFEILDQVNGQEILKRIERAGRTCYKSEYAITDESAVKFVKMIVQRGHESVLEHEKISVLVICDRGVSHEIVRHRIASYSQESTRYCDYAGGHVTFIIPPWVDEEVKPGTYSEYESTPDDATNDWLNAMWNIENIYKLLREKGWKPEQARSVLPNSLKTEIIVSMNLREWRHFFKLRTAPAAHPQMREIAVPMLNRFKELILVVFDDIG